MTAVRKQELSAVAHGTAVAIWSLDTAVSLETILAPGGLDVLAGTVGIGDRICFIAGPDRTFGDLCVLEAVPAKGDEPAAMVTHLIWSSRPAVAARKAA